MLREGHFFEYMSQQRSKEHKRGLLSRCGQRESGVEPGQCWPTEMEVLCAAGWEQLYQEKPLAQMIAEAKQNVVQRRKGVLAREQEVEENLI